MRKRLNEEKSVASTNSFGILSINNEDCMDESGSDYGSFNSMLSEEEGDKGDKYEREENV